MSRTALIATASLLFAGAVPAATIGSAEAAKPTPKPRLTATAATVSESSAKAVVTVKLAGKATKSIKVVWSTADGTAKAGSDYRAGKGSVTIKKGKRSATISIAVLGDAVHEETERFAVRLTSGQAKVPAKPVTVTITDDDAAPPAPTAPSALVGTITASRTSMVPTSGTTTLTMDVHLVPTSTAGDWRDDGTGSWTVSGSMTGIPLGCLPPTTTVAGSGTFLSGAGAASEGKAALVLSGFDPVTGAGVPSLTWSGASPSTTTSYFLLPPVPPDFIMSCVSSTSTGSYDFSLGTPGATASYTGATGPSRGVTFSYNGTSGSDTLSVTGSLTPVS